MHSNRNEALDLLRIIAALSVVAIHVTAWYSEHPWLISEQSLFISKLVSSLTFSGSRVFLLLSGFFLLGHSSYQTFDKVMKKFWHSIFLVFFWSAIFTGVFIFERNGLRLPIRSSVWEMVAWNLQHGDPYYHLWYLLLLPSFYVLLPILSWVKAKLSDRAFTFLAWTTLILGTSHLVWLTLHGSETWFPLRIFDFLGFILVGATFHKEKLRTHMSARIRGFITILAFAVSDWLISILSGDLQQNSVLLANVISTLYPVAMFVLFKNFSVHTNGFVSKLAKLGLGVYLLHPMARIFLDRITPDSVFQSTPMSIQLFLGITLVFGFSAFATFVLKRIRYTKFLVTMPS